MVDLQRCVSFRYTAKQFSYTFIIHISILFQSFSDAALLQSIKQSSLHSTVGHCWLSILNIVVCLCQRMYHTIALISHASKAMLKILQARLQQYMRRELPDG